MLCFLHILVVRPGPAGPYALCTRTSQRLAADIIMTMQWPTTGTEDSDAARAGPMLLAFQVASPSGDQRCGRLPRSLSPLQVQVQRVESTGKSAQRVAWSHPGTDSHPTPLAPTPKGLAPSPPHPSARVPVSGPGRVQGPSIHWQANGVKASWPGVRPSPGRAQASVPRAPEGSWPM